MVAPWVMLRAPRQDLHSGVRAVETITASVICVFSTIPKNWRSSTSPVELPVFPGETFKQPIEIENKGMLVFGPYFAHDGMHVTLHSDGPVRAGLVCADDAVPAVEAFVHKQPLPSIPTLDQADINGSGSLKVRAQRCKVALVVKSLAETKVRFDWARPPREIAQSTGGPAIHCSRKGTLSSASNAAGSGASPAAAARRR